MATVWLSAEESVALPDVCVETGERAPVRLPMEALSRPGWVSVLLLCNVWVYLLVRGFATERVPIALPVSERALTRHLRWQRGSAAMAAAGVVLVVAGVAADRAMVPVGGIALAAGITLGVASELGAWVGLRFSSRDRAVIVTRCHPAFAAAVRERRSGG